MEEESKLRKAEQQRIRAEEIARKKAAEADRRRAAREEAERRRAEENKQAETEKARLRAEREAAARREKEARERARRQQAAAEAAVREQEEAAREEQEAQRRAMEEQAIMRAASELSRQPSLKPTEARVKSRLELPRTRKAAAGPARKRQAGAANLYTLRPFRNTEEVKSRAAVARQRMRRNFITGGILLVLTLSFVALHLSQPKPALISGPSAAALAPGQGPMLLAGDLLLMHDRAGMRTRQLEVAELGVDHLTAEMEFTDSGDLLVLARTNEDLTGTEPGTNLLRCRLEVPDCTPVANDRGSASLLTFTVHPLDGSLFLLDGADKRLVRIDAQGKVVTAWCFAGGRPILRRW